MLFFFFFSAKTGSQDCQASLVAFMNLTNELGHCDTIGNRKHGMSSHSFDLPRSESGH